MLLFGRFVSSSDGGLFFIHMVIHFLFTVIAIDGIAGDFLRIWYEHTV